MKTISPLPSEHAERVLALFEAGSRVIVLVEGEDDRDTLRAWFSEQLPQLEFYECGGSSPLKSLLAELLAASTLKQVYAITDRDFRSEDEVSESYSEGSHLFILPRHELENYLLEPHAVWQVIHLRHPERFTDKHAVAHRLLALCQRLTSITAVNWIFFEEDRAEYARSGETQRLGKLSEGYETARASVLKEAAQRLNVPETEMNARLTAQEELVETRLTDLATAHTLIEGKRLLHWLQREDFKTGEGYLRRLLIRENKLAGVQADLRSLVLERILKSHANA
jgi:hypothetical protein